MIKIIEKSFKATLQENVSSYRKCNSIGRASVALPHHGIKITKEKIRKPNQIDIGRVFKTPFLFSVGFIICQFLFQLNSTSRRFS